MKNWFKRLIALTMTGAIMAGSMTSLAAEQNVTVAEAQTPPTGFDDEEAEGYKDISILKVENDPNDNITA